MISFELCTIRFGKQFSLRELTWKVQPGQVWTVIVPNGCGKSALMAAMLGEGEVKDGTFSCDFTRISTVSLEEQSRLIEREKKRDDSDITDTVNEGTRVSDMIAEVNRIGDVSELVDIFNIRRLLDRGFRKLSTGETRRLLFVRAMACDPDLLLLDEPFEGIDVDTVPVVLDFLGQTARHIPVVLVLNRIDDVPDFVTHVIRMEQGRISQEVVVEDPETTRQLLRQITSIRSSDLSLPPPEQVVEVTLNEDGSLVNLRDGRVAYADNVVFEGLDWRINPGEHWQVKGPNGSGKTCLLGLITGDHPQCYVNDLEVFGFRRGTGESIWQVKQHLGFVSTSLHWDYRLSVSVRNVIISGFHDTIGVYSKATNQQVALAEAWLELLGLAARSGEPFSKLSYGEQRVVLIARAMVKHPPLLLLDEPCLGLDDANRQLVLALTERLCEEGKTTLVYVTHHDEDRIASIGNRLDLGAMTH